MIGRTPTWPSAQSALSVLYIFVKASYLFGELYMGTTKVHSRKSKGQHLRLSDILKKPSQQVIYMCKDKCREGS